jgi:hypothetical protein
MGVGSSDGSDGDVDEKDIDDDELGNHENYKLFAEYKVRNAGYTELALRIRDDAKFT